MLYNIHKSNEINNICFENIVQDIDLHVMIRMQFLITLILLEIPQILNSYNVAGDIPRVE